MLARRRTALRPARLRQRARRTPRGRTRARRREGAEREPPSSLYTWHARTPVGDPVRVALAPRADRLAGSAGTCGRRGGRPDCGAAARRASGCISVAAASRAARSSSSRRPRRGGARAKGAPAQSASAFHLLPIPGDEPLVEDRVADVAPLVARDEGWRASRSRSGSAARMSGPSRGIERACSSSTGPFHCRASTREPRRTSHGRPGETVQLSLPGHERPAAVHPQMAVQDEPPSKRSSRFFPTASTESRRRPSSRSASRFDSSARVRRLDLDALADERLEPARRAVKCVALRHRVTRIGGVDRRAAAAGGRRPSVGLGRAARHGALSAATTPTSPSSGKASRGASAGGRSGS